MNSPELIDHVSWARRVNARWIAHNQLNQTAAAYMDHIAAHDPQRLALSCTLAHRLVHAIEPAEDPKPWFYGGLFSLATEQEARRFLEEHPLLASVVPALSEDHTAILKPLDEATVRKIRRVRKALKRLTREKALHG